MMEIIIILILIYLLRKNYFQNEKVTRLIQEVGLLRNELKGEDK